MVLPGVTPEPTEVTPYRLLRYVGPLLVHHLNEGTQGSYGLLFEPLNVYYHYLSTKLDNKGFKNTKVTFYIIIVKKIPSKFFSLIF